MDFFEAPFQTMCTGLLQKTLKDAYLQFFPTGAFTLIPYIVPLFEIIPKNVHEEQKRKEYLEMVTEKMECLLEDLLHCHDRNVKSREKKSAV
ncbi:hypothetical protein OSTOST_07759 [Ostertagia ostertagi]